MTDWNELRQGTPYKIDFVPLDDENGEPQGMAVSHNLPTDFVEKYNAVKDDPNKLSDLAKVHPHEVTVAICFTEVNLLLSKMASSYMEIPADGTENPMLH